VLCDDTGKLMHTNDYTGGLEVVGSCDCSPPQVFA